jgi:uncharacterized membrane protein
VTYAIPLLSGLSKEMENRPTKRNVQLAGLLLGVGLGAFVDGIVFHQLLQWHNMLSSRIPPTSMEAMRENMFWDGAFHLFAWLMVVAGVATLWQVAQQEKPLPPTLVFVGLLIIGWGFFNLVEGTINHLLLGIHHVRELPNALAWDLGFLVILGLLPVLVGWGLTRMGNSEMRP